MKLSLLRSDSSLAMVAALVALSLWSATASAGDQTPQDAWPIVGAFIEQTCAECHGEDTSKGGLSFAKVFWNLADPDCRRQWIRIHDRIETGEMPPESDQLAESDRQSLLVVLSDAIHRADHTDVLAHGRGPMRRLNRREYDENLRELLHLPHLDVRDILPEDRVEHHFNKSSQALDISRVQLAAYLDAADAALRQATAAGTAPRTPVRYYAAATKMFPKAMDHAGRESSFYAKDSKMIPLTQSDLAEIRRDDRHDEEMELAIFRSAEWPYYGYPHEFLAAEAGAYRVRFRARSVRQVRDFRLRPSPVSAPLTFRARQPSQADVSGDVREVGGWVDIQPEGAVYETSVRLARGETIEYSLLGLPVPFPITSHGGPLYYDFPPMPEGGHPGIAFRWIEITGPIDPVDWPPKSHRALFGNLPIRDATDGFAGWPIEVVSDSPREDASRLFRRFAEQAARQPVPQSALQVYEQLIFDKLDSGLPFIAAMITGYKAFLCSGHILYLREPESPDDHFAIANRLSHFLTNSAPDRQLHERAAKLHLRDAAVLEQETDRLIATNGFEGFVENFTDYWLDLKEVRRDAPDIRLYPEYRSDDYLIASMEHETRAFFATIVRDNLPATTIVDADFAMLNDRLANHYRLPRLQGSAMRKVDLPTSSPYGGLLTQATIMKVTSNGTTTSPVVRGAWVADRLLGDSPPPPPPSVPAIEPDIRGATTIRELLAQHASSDSCASCHARFDPIGMALENLDILGAWRDRYRSLEQGDEITGIDRAGHRYSYRVAQEVEPHGQLLDGRSFKDIHELKAILVARPRQLARNLLYQFTTYTTGTPVRFSDRREIEAILDQCAADGYRVGDLLNGLVQNRIFLGEAGLK
jgi:mono/diheme cytochrome c family protein